MTVNTKCFRESVKSDLSVFLSILLRIVLLGIVIAIACYMIVISLSIVTNLLKVVVPIIKAAITVYGLYVCTCLSIIALQLGGLYTMPKGVVTDKYTTFAMAGMLTIVMIFFYLGYVETSSLPVYSDILFPPVIIETVLVCLWLWLSTPLIVAYKRCKE